MGLLTRAFSTDDSKPKAYAGGGFWGGLFGGGALLATGKSALTLSSFYCAVEIISADVAMLPKAVFRKQDDKRFEFKDHAVHYLISAEPNVMMTAFDFWKVIRMRCILKGNAVVKISRNGRTGNVESLDILDNVSISKYKKKLYYYCDGDTLTGDDVLHFKGFSLDGEIGVGVVTYAAAQLGVSLEAQEYAADVYHNRGMTTGIIEAKNAYTNPESREIIMAGVKKEWGKVGKNKVGFLDDGMTYKPITVTPEEAQFLETNKNGVLEVCRWLNIAPHKLKNLDNSNYSNIYQQSTEHVQYTLQRWIIPDEQECNRKLFSEKERGSVYVKHNINFLLKGDLDQKRQYYAAAIQWGYMNPNEVRALEDQNPREGGDEYLQPSNMYTGEQIELIVQKLKSELLNPGS